MTAPPPYWVPVVRMDGCRWCARYRRACGRHEVREDVAEHARAVALLRATLGAVEVPA